MKLEEDNIVDVAKIDGSADYIAAMSHLIGMAQREAVEDTSMK